MRMTISDIEAVERVMKDDSIFPNITDDGSVSIEEYSMQAVLEHELAYVLMPNKYSVFVMVPMNSTTYEFHANIVKEGRGTQVKKTGDKVFEYIFTQTPAMKLVSYIPTCFINVKKSADLFGFKEEGMLTESIKKNNIYYDQWIMALNKNQWLK